MTCPQCPATMCPLIAADGSPWTGDKAAPCPEDANICSWWSAACSTGGIQAVVEAAASGRPVPVVGPVKPKRYDADPSRARFFDCPKASVCSWQKQALLAGRALCPPRDALKRGFDPRICLY
jgi:hypothetical protein